MNFGPITSLARALRALAQATAQTPMSLKAIAAATGQKESALERSFAKARLAGLVMSVPGAKGGYYLVNAPSEITLDMVAGSLGGVVLLPCVRKIDPQPCKHCAKKCPFQSSLKIANSLLEKHLSETTIDTLADKDEDDGGEPN